MNLDDFLDSALDTAEDALEADIAEASSDLIDSISGLPALASARIELVNIPEGELDPRLKLFSHSSRTLLHGCPRKYELYRLGSESVALSDEKETEQSVTFAYGTTVGVGIQEILQGKELDEVILASFLAWSTDLLAETPRQKKSFSEAIFAVTQFEQLLSSSELSDYELVYTESNGVRKPAVELSFKIELPDGFSYRGYIDAVLQHKVTKHIMVLESKTSSGTANPAMYKNSGQALGYAIVLDTLFGKLASYSVLYLVWETKTRTYKLLIFAKSLLQRALWLGELLIDVESVLMYNAHGIFPMRGSFCYEFFRDCEYLGLCTLQTKNFQKPLTVKALKEMEEIKYDFTFDFYSLVDNQLERGNDNE